VIRGLKLVRRPPVRLLPTMQLAAGRRLQRGRHEPLMSVPRTPEQTSSPGPDGHGRKKETQPRPRSLDRNRAVSETIDMVCILTLPLMKSCNAAESDSALPFASEMHRCSRLE
jgi:hypothetical protein